MTPLRKTPKILLTLHHVYSRRDIYGNVYWITYATSTVSGRTLSFNTPSDSNSMGMANEALGGFGRYHSTDQQVPIREWERQRRRVDMHNSCMDDDILEALRKLAQGK